ncbi:MAG: helix-turn-helix domain-containing protein, partial [Chloroflexota bacterium]
TGLRLEDQLNGLLDVPADLIAEDIQKVADLNGMTDEREQFIKDPHHALPCLVEEIWAYWNAVLTAHWSRISATLDNDVNYRARQLALEGIEAVLKELNEQLESPNRETLIITKSHYDLKTELDGRGIQFYPSLFELGLVWQVGTTWQPSIGYNARGAGLWYEPPAIQTDEAIELTLGASKARLLTALQHPYTTSDLSHLLHVSAGAVSQQLTKLAQAGLVLSHRSGSRVYYRLSPRGAQLLEVFS